MKEDVIEFLESDEYLFKFDSLPTKYIDDILTNLQFNVSIGEDLIDNNNFYYIYVKDSIRLCIAGDFYSGVTSINKQ